MTFGPLKGKRRVRRFSTYDLEWTPHTLELRLVGVFDGRTYRRYTTIADFLNAELRHATRGRWYYAHAGGLADLRFVLEYLIRAENPDVRVHASFSGSSAIIVKVAKGGKRVGKKWIGEDSWFFVDSYWLLRQPLRKIGEWMGMAKGGDASGTRERCKYPHGACTCDPIFFAPEAELAEYNEQDCRILWHAIDHFEDTLRRLGGELQKTVASSAMNLFRRVYLDREIRTSERVNAVSREAYIASRVEVYRHRLEPDPLERPVAEYWDVNSSFPYAMTFAAPGNARRTQKKRPKDGTLYLGRATVTVSEDCALPPLPYRSKGSRLYFPTGTWAGWFSSVDLELLEEWGGTVESFDEAITFEPFNALADYARQIYELRRASDDEAEKVVLKILLNSLYGKFAEGSTKQRLYLNPSSTACPHVEKGRTLHPSDGVPGSCWEYLSAGIWLHTEEKTVPHAHVPISTFITARARAVLGRFMRAASEVYYCDTDGFAAHPADTFDVSDALGALKHEKTIYEASFAAPKLYALRTKPEADAWMIRAKGFSGIGYSEFCALLEGEEIQFEHFSRIKEGLRRGAISPEERTVGKGLGQRKGSSRVQTLRPKRCILADGSTRPWSVDELRAGDRVRGIGEASYA